MRLSESILWVIFLLYLLSSNGKFLPIPHISYVSTSLNTWFPSSEYIPQKRNYSFPGSKVNLNKSVAISFVNGIYHSLEECQNISRIIEDSFYGLKVHLFYNPTTGSWVKDATRAGFDLVLRSSDIILAKNLTNFFRSIFKELEPNGRIIHLAHSGGAILTYLAAKYHLRQDEINRIDVITFGGGKSLTKKYFKNSRVINYYAKNDPLTLIDKRTNQLLKLHERNQLKQKKLLKTTIKEIPNNSTDPYVIIYDQKHNTSFVFLHSFANHRIVDHSMFGPTYRYAINLESEFVKDFVLQMIFRHQRDTNLFRKFRKISANITGMHHFWKGKEKYFIFYRQNQQDVELNETSVSSSWPVMLRMSRYYSSSPHYYLYRSWKFLTDVIKPSPISNPSLVTDLSSSLPANVFVSSSIRSMRKRAARITHFHGFFSGKYKDLVKLQEQQQKQQSEYLVLNETQFDENISSSSSISAETVNRSIADSIETNSSAHHATTVSFLDFLDAQGNESSVPFINEKEEELVLSNEVKEKIDMTNSLATNTTHPTAPNEVVASNFSSPAADDMSSPINDPKPREPKEAIDIGENSISPDDRKFLEGDNNEKTVEDRSEEKKKGSVFSNLVSFL